MAWVAVNCSDWKNPAISSSTKIREDGIPAWKKALSESQLSEMGETFEDIEKRQFGGDGFDDAVKRMTRIEQTLGLADLAQFTAPKP